MLWFAREHAKRLREDGMKKLTRKYTIVYQEGCMIGSHYNAVVHYAHVETDDIVKLLREDDRFGSSVLLCFDGHCEESR